MSIVLSNWRTGTDNLGIYRPVYLVLQENTSISISSRWIVVKLSGRFSPGVLYRRVGKDQLFLQEGFLVERKFWDEAIETIAPAAQRRLENERFQTQLDLVWARSAFYQAKFAEAGVKREAIRDLADLPLLPFTEKDECRRSQK